MNRIEELTKLCEADNRIPLSVRKSKESAREFLREIDENSIPINNKYVFILSKWVSGSQSDTMLVKDISYVGQQETVDIEVETDHSYKANGIVAHNTVNLPNSATEDDINTIYMEAWKNRLKGITVYRDGCRNGVLVSVDDKNKEEKKEEKHRNLMCIDNGQVAKRPKSIPCKIFRFSNKGEKWIGVIGLIDDKPYEIFTGLLDKLDIPNWVEDGFIVKNKEHVTVDGEDKLKSRYDICYTDKNGEQYCVEGLSRTFNPEYWNYAKLISGLLRHHMPISYVIKVISSLNLDASNINTWKNGVIRLLKKFNDSIDGEFEKCPECGGRLVRENGCQHCLDCSYSRCD